MSDGGTQRNRNLEGRPLPKTGVKTSVEKILLQPTRKWRHSLGCSGHRYQIARNNTAGSKKTMDDRWTHRESWGTATGRKPGSWDPQQDSYRKQPARVQLSQG
jgi:hypothetical protein